MRVPPWALAIGPHGPHPGPARRLHRDDPSGAAIERRRKKRDKEIVSELLERMGITVPDHATVRRAHLKYRRSSPCRSKVTSATGP